MAVDSGTYTPEVIARRKAIADSLYRKKDKPIEHWAQGVAHLSDVALSGYADKKNRDDQQAASLEIAKLLMPGGNMTDAPSMPGMPMNLAPPSEPNPPPSYQPGTPNARVQEGFEALEPTRIYANDEQSPLDPVVPEKYANAISKIESGGNYSAMGPQTKTGDRAYGKYQVMGNNVGPWTQNLYGQPMTPEQFVADPKAQEQVFQKQFGTAMDKFGSPQDAASVWFTGKPLAQGAGNKDVLGTTGQAYVDKFNAAARDPKSEVAMALAPSGGQAPQLFAQPQGQPQAPMQMAQAGGNQREMIAKMLQSQNPYVQQMGQSLATRMLEQQFATDKPTDEMREYNLYRKQGGTDTFTDWKVGLKKAGAIQNNVQIDQKGETEFSKEAGKLQAKRFNDLAEDAPMAKQMLSDVEMLRDLGTKIETGKGAEVKSVIGPYAQALGIDVKGLDEIQAYEAIVNRVAPNLRVKGSGAQSDFELRNFLKSIPSIGNTPGGNEIASRVLEGLYQNKIKAAEIGAQALSKEITPKEAEKLIRDLPDPMKEWREFKKGSTAKPQSGVRKFNPATGRIE